MSDRKEKFTPESVIPKTDLKMSMPPVKDYKGSDLLKNISVFDFFGTANPFSIVRTALAKARGE